MKKLRIFISNDDGINAPGLKIAERIARELSDDIWVVAPEREQSGASHSLTIQDPLRIRKISKRRYAVDGTPTDCVMLGVNHVLDGELPDLMLSGVNRGANLGEDVLYSGTVAAASEGAILGIPSIALSQAATLPGRALHWGTAEHFGPGLVKKLVKEGWQDGVLLNVNFPPVVVASARGVAITRQGSRDVSALEILEREHPRGGNYYWLAPRRKIGQTQRTSDLHAVYREHKISVTPLMINRTSASERRRLSKVITSI